MTTRRPWSLGRRMGLGLSVAIVVSWLTAAGVAGLVLKHEIDTVFDSALQEVAQRILPLAYSELLSREEGDPPQHLAPIGPHREAITYVVRDGEGRDLLQSSDAEPARIPKKPSDGFATVDGLRLYSEAAVSGSIRVTTVEPIAHRAETLKRAVFGLLLPLTALVPLALFAAAHVLGRSLLGPIVAFRDRIGSRGRGNLDPLGATGLPLEIAPIAGAVDALIERLRGALETERSFTANSAHELRTPIAAALAQTQRLMAEIDDDALRERARAVAASLRRLSSLSEKLLQLAKAEGGGLLAERPGPLGGVLALVVEEVDRRRDIADRLTQEVAAGDDVAVDVDADAFAILARNLIENAAIHGDPTGRIVLRFDGRALEVESDGPAIGPETLVRLGRRFERGATRAEGSGLGLAIVAAICRGAGARFEMLSPAPGRVDGFLARVRFAEPRAT
ncbi:MAG: ATP-binding protein [Hyphomicrobiales bacterium]|nr:ATP-binding protein [Hyphomicrobiales bacterium]